MLFKFEIQKIIYGQWEMHFRSILIAMAFSVFTCYPSGSQTVDSWAHASLAEKIYLQLDNRVYTTNQTIWFKSIVANAINHAPSKLSGVLYVELIAPDKQVVEMKLIKLENGIGEGFFELHQSYDEGVYQVRAYTEWNKNFGTDFIFTGYIQLFSSTGTPKADPVEKIILVKELNGVRHLKATLNPLAIDSLHKRDLSLVVTLDDKKDSVTIKRNRENKYLADYAIPEKYQFVTLKIQTKNQFSYTKTIALNEDRFDLQFFPEGGELVHGLRSKVGFKALDYNGKGKMVKGEIVDKAGNIIVPFVSNQMGMGYFTLNNADSTANYNARLSSHAGGKLSLQYPLPKVVRL